MRRSLRGGSSRPHVLIIVENCSFPSDRRVWLQASTLQANGFDVSVISPAAEPLDTSAFDVVEGIEVHRFVPPPETGTPASYARGYVSAWLKVAAVALRIYRRRPFQVIQACNPPDTYFVLAAPFKRLGVRFLFDQHDLSPELYAERFARPRRSVIAALRWLERGSHRSADHVLTVNESCRELLLSRTRTMADRLTVVRTGVDLARLHRVEPEAELRNGRRFLCCYLGEMGPQDGVDLVLAAAEMIVHQRGRDDVQFALLGFGEQLPSLRRFAASRGLDEHVTFTGRVTSDTISRYLSTADLGLQPDRKSALSDVCSMLKTIEYLAFGLPVIALDLRETRRTAGPAALLLQEPDPGTFADAVEQLLEDPDRRSRMAEEGQARAHGPLAWAHSASVYVDVVGGLARSARQQTSTTGTGSTVTAAAWSS